MNPTRLRVLAVAAAAGWSPWSAAATPAAAVRRSVEAGKGQTSGLTAPDDCTLNAHLTGPAGFWLTELALWSADAVDQKVIQAAVGKGGQEGYCNPAMDKVLAKTGDAPQNCRRGTV
jgi:hypothetical protein